MRVSFFASALLVSFASAASADSPNWTGFYIGASVGGSSYAVDWHDATLPGGPTIIPLGDNKISGLIGGIHAGFNYQWQKVVFGAEVSGSLVSGDKTSVMTGNPALGVRHSLEQLSTMRVKLGYDVGPALVYVTGGLAHQKAEHSAIFLATGNPYGSGVYKDSDWGWVAGLGLAYAVTPRVSVRVEGLRHQFGEIIVGPSQLNDPFRGDNRLQRSVDTLTVGFNVKF